MDVNKNLWLHKTGSITASPIYLPIRGKDDLIWVSSIINIGRQNKCNKEELVEKEKNCYKHPFHCSFLGSRSDYRFVCVWGKELTIRKITLMLEVQSSKSTKMVEFVLNICFLGVMSCSSSQRFSPAETQENSKLVTENEKQKKTNCHQRLGSVNLAMTNLHFYSVSRHRTWHSTFETQ